MYFNATVFDTLPMGSVTLTFPRNHAIGAFAFKALLCVVLAVVCCSLHWLVGIAVLAVAYASVAHPDLQYIDDAGRDMVFTFDAETRTFRRGSKGSCRFEDIGFLHIDKTLSDSQSRYYYSIYVVLKGDHKRIYLTDESYREAALGVATAIATVVGVQVQIDHY